VQRTDNICRKNETIKKGAAHRNINDAWFRCAAPIFRMIILIQMFHGPAAQMDNIFT